MSSVVRRDKAQGLLMFDSSRLCSELFLSTLCFENEVSCSRSDSIISSRVRRDAFSAVHQRTTLFTTVLPKTSCPLHLRDHDKYNSYVTAHYFTFSKQLPHSDQRHHDEQDLHLHRPAGDHMGLSPNPLFLRQVRREATEDDDETGKA